MPRPWKMLHEYTLPSCPPVMIATIDYSKIMNVSDPRYAMFPETHFCTKETAPAASWHRFKQKKVEQQNKPNYFGPGSKFEGGGGKSWTSFPRTTTFGDQHRSRKKNFLENFFRDRSDRRGFGMSGELLAFLYISPAFQKKISRCSEWFQNICQKVQIVGTTRGRHHNVCTVSRGYLSLSLSLSLSYSILSLSLSYPILILILSYPILPYPTLSLSYSILSYPILSYPTLFYPILPLERTNDKIWQLGVGTLYFAPAEKVPLLLWSAILRSSVVPWRR